MDKIMDHLPQVGIDRVNIGIPHAHKINGTSVLALSKTKTEIIPQPEKFRPIG